MSLPTIFENTQVTLTIDNASVVYTWAEFASQLTTVNCDGFRCATAIASTASLNIFWLIFASVLVFLMQAGFTLLELGSVHMKNTKNILTKNLGDVTVGAFCFYILGFAFAMGEGNEFIGDTGFAFKGDSFLGNGGNEGALYNGAQYAFWLFQWAFAATAATIVSGAVAERATFVAYLTYSFCLTIFIYPVVAHWGWSGTGWASAFKSEDRLFDVGVIDFAGSGVVHMTGGMAALVGAIFLGPRTGRFDGNGVPVEIPQQSVAFQTIGTMILWFGWYGFNCGSTLSLDANFADVAAKTACTTTISAAISGVFTVIWGKLFHDRIICPSLANNGILAGLVGITAGCSTVEPEGAVVIGFVSSIVYYASSKLLLKLQIDDVVDAVPVHLCCGIWGVLAAGLFATERNYIMAYGFQGTDTSCGGFSSCNGNGGRQFAANLVFVLAIIAWVGGTTAVMFFALKQTGLLRVSLEVETNGLDISEHGGHAYQKEKELPSARAAGEFMDNSKDYQNLSTPAGTDRAV